MNQRFLFRFLLPSFGAGILLLVFLVYAPARWFIGDPVILGVQNVDAPEAKVQTQPKTFEDLCKEDPLEAIAESLRIYKATVNKYTCNLVKQECIKGQLRDREVIYCQFQEHKSDENLEITQPFAVTMRWLEGKGRAEATLYVENEHDGKLNVVPANPLARKFVPVAKRNVNDPEVMETSRFPITEFGIYNGTMRVHKAWKAVQARGEFKPEYLGILEVPELDGKKCYTIRRTSVQPEEDGQTLIILYFDVETKLQIGSILYAGENLIGSYFFKNLVLNPDLPEDTFTVDALKK